MNYLTLLTSNESILGVILGSAVISAIISGIVSLIVARMDRRSTLDATSHSTKLALTIEIYKDLQNALSAIGSGTELKTDDKNINDHATTVFIAMFHRSHEIMKLTDDVLKKVAFLLPESDVNILQKQFATLENEYVELLASSYFIRGVDIVDETSINLIAPNQLQERMKSYIDDSAAMVESLTTIITKTLRKLCNT